MPSPFPGMNPYLEQNDTWEDFHQRFITHSADVLGGQVGGNYLVKVEVRLYLHELPAKDRAFFGRGDVGVTGPAASGGAITASVSAAAPMHVPLPGVDVERLSSIEIRDRRNRRLVTVIELLSPTNKTPGPDRDDYLVKRTRLLDSRVNLVEIDLRRGGERPRPPVFPACDYYVLLRRAEDWQSAGIWPIGLRDPLPTIPIPLMPPDADVHLDLQALLHRVFDGADYGKYIYAESPQPSLSPDDASWARQFVPQAM